MSRFEAEQARLRAQLERAPQAYVDRVMDESVLDSADTATAPVGGELAGVRSWVVESRAGWANSDDSGASLHAFEAGIHAEYRREMLNFGDLSFQFDGRGANGDSQSGLFGLGSLGQSTHASGDRLTLRMTGVPLTSRRFADIALGDFYAERTDGLQRYERLAFGSSPLRGASVRLFDADGELRLGGGLRGWLVGSPYPGFERSQGSKSWIAMTRRVDGDGFAAFQIEQANNVPAFYYDGWRGQGSGSKDVRSFAASVGRNNWPLRDGEPRGRLTLIASRVQSSTPDVAQGSSVGLFAEGAVRLGSYRHTASLFVARPNLHFGDTSLATGTSGGHWRVDYTSARLSWGGGVDLDRGPQEAYQSGTERSRRAFSLNGQYLLDRDSAIGGSFSAAVLHQQGGTNFGSNWNAEASTPSSTQKSFLASWYGQSRFFGLPRSRLTLTVQRNRSVAADSDTATGQELVWEQDWFDARASNGGREFTTLIGYARDESGGVVRHYPTAGAQFRGRLAGTVEVQGNLRYTSRTGGLYTSRGLSGSLSLEQSLAAGWRVGATLSLNQARTALVRTLADTAQVYRSNEKTLQLYLRWQGQSGQPFAPIGDRAAGAGSGDIEGQVFLDANRDGIQQPGEALAAGVEVVLDGRFRTVTDRNGRFEFRLVAVGRHRLSVTPESIPLPWVDSGYGAGVEVPLRGTGSVTLALVRGTP
ncbi:hypothetical protein [Pseudacidovorax intermedius]|uniref:SdrD B-like protein n=1 Tax=Pseudacidovorax intermedius TaxID=433924 RepID=A0A370FBU9_9BURK|nr:hypothetical protein [Pseudacidovorax intermedius]RDI21258.1 SdrD B-like protein [Pseudacidovorax intermedius]